MILRQFRLRLWLRVTLPMNQARIVRVCAARLCGDDMSHKSIWVNHLPGRL